MSRQLGHLLNRRMQQLDYLARRLLSPTQRIAHKRNHLAHLQARLQSAAIHQLQKRQRQLVNLQQNLSHLNPEAVLHRGYALVLTEDGNLVRSNRALQTGQKVRLRLAEGQADAAITDPDSQQKRPN